MAPKDPRLALFFIAIFLSPFAQLPFEARDKLMGKRLFRFLFAVNGDVPVQSRMAQCASAVDTSSRALIEDMFC